MAETPVEPGLPGGIIVPRVDRLVMDVRVIAAEAGDLLDQAAPALAINSE